jgi:hypothetical protein
VRNVLYLTAMQGSAGWANGDGLSRLSSYPLRDMQPTNRLALSSLSMAL